MSSPLEQTKQELQKILGREPSCSLLKDGKFLADFFSYGASATEFVGTTEEEALTRLLKYLKDKKPKSPDVDPV